MHVSVSLSLLHLFFNLPEFILYYFIPSKTFVFSYNTYTQLSKKKKKMEIMVLRKVIRTEFVKLTSIFYWNLIKLNDSYLHFFLLKLPVTLVHAHGPKLVIPSVTLHLLCLHSPKTMLIRESYPFSQRSPAERMDDYENSQPKFQ